MFSKVASLCFVLTLSLVAKSELPRYPVQPVDSPPKIDGTGDDACWKTLPAMGDFVDKDGVIAKVQSEARIGYDKSNLYLLVRFNEPMMDKIFAQKTKHDSGIWTDDDLEVFIAPEEKPSVFYVFRANSLGATEEAHMEDPAGIWNVPWQCAVKKEKTAWTVEMAIPYSSIKAAVPADGKIWRINVCRFRAHAKEATAWSNPLGSFPNRSQFGELLFLRDPLLTSVKITGKPRSQGGEIVITATGKPAGYHTRVFWYHDGAMAPAGYGGLNFKGPQAETSIIIFKADGEKCSAQAEIIEAKGANRTVFRTDRFTVKYTDPLTIRMNRIGALYEELKGAALPVQFDAVKATWPARFEALKNNPDELASRQLVQELCAAKWIQSLPETVKQEPILWFPQMPFADIGYDFLPKAGQIGGTVLIQAMADEYEPGCVNLLPLAADGKFQVQPRELTGPNGQVLPASAFEVRVLKNWYQAGKEGFRDSDGSAVWVPELLVKDDSMIVPDHVKRRNIFKHFNDGETLKPVSIPRFTTRQFWLTVHVPKDQKPGLYKGFAQMECDGKPSVKIPVEVNVLPFTLPDSQFTWSMYYLRRYAADKEPAPGFYRRYEEDIRMAPQYGLTAMSILEGVPAKMDGDRVVAYDFSVVRKALELRKKFGLMGKTFFMGGSWYTAPIDTIYRQKAKDLLEKPHFKANWMLLCKGLLELKKEYGLKEIYMYGLDEPGYDPSGERMKAERILCEWSKEAGIQCASAITVAGALEVKDVIGLPILDLPTGEIGEHRRSYPFKETWLYWHPVENPTVDRMMSGIVLWYGGYQGAAPWAYQMFTELGMGDCPPKMELGWDDWVANPYGYRHQSYAYPGETVPVPTLEYAAFREGVDDVKYLELLEAKVKALENKSLNAEGKAVLAQVKAWLDSPPKKYHGTYYSLKDSLTAKDFAEFRMHTAHLLLQTEKVLAGGGNR